MKDCDEGVERLAMNHSDCGILTATMLKALGLLWGDAFRLKTMVMWGFGDEIAVGAELVGIKDVEVTPGRGSSSDKTLGGMRTL